MSIKFEEKLNLVFFFSICRDCGCTLYTVQRMKQRQVGGMSFFSRMFAEYYKYKILKIYLLALPPGGISVC